MVLCIYQAILYIFKLLIYYLETRPKLEETIGDIVIQRINLETDDLNNRVTSFNFHLNPGIQKLQITKTQTNEKSGFKAHKARSKALILGLLNSVKQRADNKLYDILDVNSYIASANELQKAQSTPKFLKCKCNKSLCLKQYCDCFANGNMCTTQCQCTGCHNIDEYADEREEAIGKLKQTNQTVEETPLGISCKCKKSKCQKRYCDCFQNGQKCGTNCTCNECENQEKIDQVEQRVALSQFDDNSRNPRSPVHYRGSQLLFRRYDSMNYSNSFGFSRRNIITQDGPYYLKQDSQGFN